MSVFMDRSVWVHILYGGESTCPACWGRGVVHSDAVTLYGDDCACCRGTGAVVISPAPRAPAEPQAPPPSSEGER